LKTENQNDFNTALENEKFTKKRLIEAAIYAPQWIPFVEKYFNIEGFASSIWWLHAHTNSYHDSETETEIARYSAVSMSDFRDGAVDKDWFYEAYEKAGKENWKIFYDGAKYVCDGTGHSRAKLYADVLLGEKNLDDLMERITEKRNQDYLRVYGLVPLKNHEEELLERYRYLQQFKKESRQFGSQRQASEGLAVRIAMENLARNAGYSDPNRLTWAMERKEIQSIFSSVKEIVIDDVRLNLIISDIGKAEIEVFRKEKKLKNIPSKYSKDEKVTALKDFRKTLREQYSRTRKSLELAMVQGDIFSSDEIGMLMEHPVVKPMLSKLVLKSDGFLGYFEDGQLINTSGKKRKPGKEIIIAHAIDLYESKEWKDFQHHCFQNELVQPFKQIFRELYIQTDDEKAAKTVSQRYAGHQIQPRKTAALLKSRGWTVDYEEGLQKVFHKKGYIASIYAMADWFSPAEVENSTLESVQFISRKDYKPIPFDEIDMRVFSEIMRDIDLVVSVAHAGGVDPEASHSTIEMRGAMLREITDIYKLNNVKIKDSHAFIKGSMAEYTVHLGSGVVHKSPAIYISILPVHSQHRGRIFLPFVDDDPKSAEVVSKILLLGRDNEIKDPMILKQIMEEN
jgi:hypothetical protein